MVIETSLAQKSSQFGENLKIKGPASEKTDEEQNSDMKAPDQQGGDKVSFSQEARALAAPEEQGATLQTKKKDEQDDGNAAIKQLKDRIAALEKEIKEIEEDSSLTEKEKTAKVQSKQTQLMELRNQLVKAQKADLKAQGMASGGGTRANGFGKSVSSF